jgi:hypothetical protein
MVFLVNHFITFGGFFHRFLFFPGGPGQALESSPAAARKQNPWRELYPP